MKEKQENKLSDMEDWWGSFLQTEVDPSQVDAAMDTIRSVLKEKEAELLAKKQKKPISTAWRTIMKNRITQLAAAVILLAAITSLTFGASKLFKRYFKTSISSDGVVKTMEAVDLSGKFTDKKEIDKVAAEIKELRKAGKFEKTFVREFIKDGVLYREYKVRYVLPSGKEIITNEGEKVVDN